MTTPSHKRDKSQDLALLGTTIAGKYRVLELLGQGGFGSVFLVEITAGMVGEKLALKLIPREFSGDEKLKAQFLNEIRVAMRMVNKYVVQVRDVGETEDGQLYYTMDYCPGETLAALLRREGLLSAGRAIPIALRILEALKTAHASGVIHRDLKPANVMVFQQNSHETSRVLDFGIATAIQAGRPGSTAFVGSPHYMPPEQFLNEELGFFTDTYSVGVILYECLTGQKPYQGHTPQEVYDGLKSRPVTSPDQLNPALAGVPGLSAVISRALERNPDHRYQTAKDLFNDLKAILEGKYEPAPAAPQVGKPARTRRARVARRSYPTSVASGTAFALAAGGAAVVALWLFLRDPASSPPEPHSREPLPLTVADPRSDPAPPPAQLPTSSASTPGTPVTPSAEVVIPSPVSAEEPTAAKSSTPDPAVARWAAEERAQKLIAEAKSEAQKGQRWDKVRELCADAVGLGHSSAEAHRLKGLAELRLGMLDEALHSLREARALTPREKVDLNLILLQIEAHGGLASPNPGEAAALLTEAVEALKSKPLSREATLSMLQLLEKAEREEELVALVEKARAEKIEDPAVDRLYQKYLVDLPREREARAQALLKEAQQTLEKRDFALAAKKAEDGFRLKPIPELAFILAEAHLQSGKIIQAQSALSEVGRRVKDDSEGLARLGILYGRSYLQNLNDPKKSGEALQHALENLEAALELLKDPKVKQPLLIAAARTYRARCYAYQLNLDKLDEELKFAKAAHDRDTELIYHQAESYFLLGERAKDPDRSAAFMRSIQRLTWYNDFKETKRDPRGCFLMGRAYLRLGGKRDNFDKALNQFAVAQRYGYPDLEKLYTAMAETQMGLQDPLKAGQRYRDAWEVKPLEEYCLKAANCFLEAKLKDSAEKMLKEGLLRHPQSQKIQNLLSSIRR